MADGKDKDADSNPDGIASAARALASLGGIARAAALGQKKRSAIAKKAAEQRWAKVSGLPRSTHEGVIRIGDIELPCAVLDDGKPTRVLTVSGVNQAFGSKKKSPTGRSPLGTANFPAFLASKNVLPFVSSELSLSLATPLVYRPRGQAMAYGYDTKWLALICESLMAADDAGVLLAVQKRLAEAARILYRTLARVGIDALVDEATGYQYDRASDELQRLAEAYVVEMLRPWVRLFPSEFFRQVYRLHGWPYKPGITQGPRYVGKFINKYVYELLPEGVLEKLRQRNPVIGKHRRHKHTQFLSENIGEPAVIALVASITTLATVSLDKAHFDQMVRAVFPKKGGQTVIAQTVEAPVLPLPRGVELPMLPPKTKE